MSELNDEFLVVIQEQYSTCFLSFDAISSQNGKLSFSDTAHVRQVVTCLDEMLETYNDLYDNKFSHLTIEELDSLDESLRFDENFILQHFADQYQFLSAHSITAEAVNEWLDTEDPDWDNDPEDQYPIGDYFRAIVDQDCEVYIDGELFDLCEESNSSFKRKENKITRTCWWEGNGGNCCLRGSGKQYFEYNSGGNRVKVKIYYAGGIFLSKTVGKIVHYKRKRRRWKRSRANLSVRAAGQLRDVSCTVRGQIGKVKTTKRRKERKVQMIEWGAILKLVRSGDLSVVGRADGRQWLVSL